ncbi:MAG: diguanylate cyclase, partial [Chloroflexi bacterium]|nr:diguanylate cyclase [Chloroflexota bacterium]
KRVEEATIPLNGGEAKATLSLGVSALKPEMKRPSDLIERADQALYEAKRSGRNRARVAQWS